MGTKKASGLWKAMPEADKEPWVKQYEERFVRPLGTVSVAYFFIIASSLEKNALPPASNRSLNASTISSAWAHSRLLRPARPTSLATNLVIVRLWAMVSPFHSRRGRPP